MSHFETLRDKLIENFKANVYGRRLFTVDVDKDYLWNLYLDSFPAGTNPMFRKRREYDCSCCRSFIRDIGGTVWIDDNYVRHSIFSFDAQSEIYQPVMDALAAYVESQPITGIYLRPQKFGGMTGTISSLEHTVDGGVTRWKHFYLPLDKDMHVFRPGAMGNTAGKQNAEYAASHDVLQRSLEEITDDAVDILLELIASNNLYRGKEWESALEQFRDMKRRYNGLQDGEKSNFCWAECDIQRNPAVGMSAIRIRNNSIGVLLQDLSEGKDLEESIRKYESIVAPANYKRPKPVFTKRMLEAAQKTVEEMGYLSSLPRRFAMLDDIPIANTLFSNKDAAKATTGDVFTDMLKDAVEKTPDFSSARQVPVDQFVNHVLPFAEGIEVYMDEKHERNLFSLIAPVDKDAPSMFKWTNGFSWAYNGNLTSSDIRENVTKAGGRVDGVLRFSIQWNEDQKDDNDLDAHCIIAKDSFGRDEIYYAHKYSTFARGALDIDIIEPFMQCLGKPAVENIIFTDLNALKSGAYRFFVHCYTNRGGKGGFRAEIEFEGQTYRYDYRGEMPGGSVVDVATVAVDRDGRFSINHELKPETSARQVWNVPCNRFVPVTAIFLSPNYWGENHVGARHIMFALKDCLNPDTPNGFFNEYLKNELMPHRKVFEALGGKMKVAPSDNQVSGIGFNSTERDELVVKVKGKTKQVIRVIF